MCSTHAPTPVKSSVCRRTDGERFDPATVPVGRVVHATIVVVDGRNPVDDDGGADRVRAGERVNAVVAVRILGARRPTARAQGRRRSHGGHRQAVNRQGDPEPAGSTATAIAAAAAETGGGNGTRQVRGEEPSAGVPAAAHPVHGRVPVHAVPDGFGR